MYLAPQNIPSAIVLTLAIKLYCTVHCIKCLDGTVQKSAKSLNGTIIMKERAKCLSRTVQRVCKKCFRKTVQKSVKCLNASKLPLRLLKLLSGVKANCTQRVRCSVNWESIQQNVKQNAKCCDLVLVFTVSA